MRFTDDYQWVGTSSGAGGPYRHPDAPWRAVAHSIEGRPGSLPALAYRHLYPPHFWLDPYNKVAVQTVDTDGVAWALHHPPGAVDTNHMHAVQWEIAGYAHSLSELTSDQLQWIADKMKPVCDNHHIDVARVIPQVPTAEGSFGVDAPTRMSDTEWASFDGVCGHQNVPANAHWDPGSLDLVTIAGHMQDTPTLPPPPKPDIPWPAMAFLLEE